MKKIALCSFILSAVLFAAVLALFRPTAALGDGVCSYSSIFVLDSDFVNDTSAFEAVDELTVSLPAGKHRVRYVLPMVCWPTHWDSNGVLLRLTSSGPAPTFTMTANLDPNNVAFNAYGIPVSGSPVYFDNWWGDPLLFDFHISDGWIVLDGVVRNNYATDLQIEVKRSNDYYWGAAYVGVMKDAYVEVTDIP